MFKCNSNTFLNLENEITATDLKGLNVYDKSMLLL